MLAARRSGHTDGVNASSIPHDLVVLALLSEDSLVDALPNAGLHRLVSPREQVIPPLQPGSRGRYSDGIPVLITNTIPVRAA